eukprot:scaffold2015_cov186-Amphora_coffeaeformis.AAC.15
MKFTAAVLFAFVSTANATKIERARENDRELRWTASGFAAQGGGSAKSGSDKACLEACEATCAVSDCIPLDATAAPTTGKSGKGGNKFGTGKSGKGSSSEAPVSF